MKKPGQPPKVLKVKSPGKDDEGDFTNAKKLRCNTNLVLDHEAKNNFSPTGVLGQLAKSGYRPSGDYVKSNQENGSLVVTIWSFVNQIKVK